jgi:hypothetical protein
LPWLCCAGSTDCITEHCIEIARVKRAGQAAFLVGKLKKYTAQLPAADAKLRGLTDSMSSHAGDGRLPFVQRMLEALKAHAKGVNMRFRVALLVDLALLTPLVH